MYRVIVTFFDETASGDDALPKEVFSQVVTAINVPAFVRVLNPEIPIPEAGCEQDPFQQFIDERGLPVVVNDGELEAFKAFLASRVTPEPS